MLPLFDFGVTRCDLWSDLGVVRSDVGVVMCDICVTLVWLQYDVRAARCDLCVKLWCGPVGLWCESGVARCEPCVIFTWPGVSLV